MTRYLSLFALLVASSCFATEEEQKGEMRWRCVSEEKTEETSEKASVFNKTFAASSDKTCEDDCECGCQQGRGCKCSIE